MGIVLAIVVLFIAPLVLLVTAIMGLWVRPLRQRVRRAIRRQ